MSKITFYIARHGKTVLNTLGKVQGWCDSPLTTDGIEVAGYLAKGLEDIQFRSAYCSDFGRTRQTLRIVLQAKGQNNIPITELEGLREACFGSFEAGSNDDLWDSTAEYLGYSSDGLYQDYLANKIPYSKILDAIKAQDTLGIGESYAQVEARTQYCLRKMGEEESKYGEGNILVIGHGVAIYAMLYSLGGDKIFEGEGLENAAVCKVSYHKGEINVETMGDMSYVEKGRRFFTQEL